METKQFIITGKVQGVFYRASAKKKAEELSLKGWIKNTSVGNVEGMITGNDQQIKDFIQWCKTGPGKAVVENVQVLNQDFKNFDSFKIVR